MPNDATARHEQDTILAYHGQMGLSAEEAAAYGELRDALPGLEELLRDPAKDTKERIEAATKEREEATSSLHREDGTRLYADEEHERRLAAVEREHAAAFDAIEADIDGGASPAPRRSS